MEVIFGLIPSMIVIGLGLVIVLYWSAKSGQYDDLEGEAYRILMDEDIDASPDTNKVSNAEVKDPQKEN